jgi:hypothetical protein
MWRYAERYARKALALMPPCNRHELLVAPLDPDVLQEVYELVEALEAMAVVLAARPADGLTPPPQLQRVATHGEVSWHRDGRPTREAERRALRPPLPPQVAGTHRTADSVLGGRQR